MNSDDLVTQQEGEFRKLRRARRGSLLAKLLGIGMLIVMLHLCVAYLQQTVASESNMLRAQSDLLALRTPWARDLVDRYDSYSAWLLQHGTSFELAAFDSVSETLFRTLVTSSDGNRTGASRSFVQGVVVSFHFALLRISFICIACWRLWFVCALLAGLFAYYSRPVHSSRDILGETNNGRLFYSGSRVQLQADASSGATDLLVTGLACPPHTSLRLARTSDLGTLLEKFGALSDTTLTLAAILNYHADYPAYIAKSEEQNLLGEFFDGARLADNAFLILEKVLSLHAAYCEHDPEQLAQFARAVQTEQGSIDKYRYANLMQGSLHRVLTAKMREQIAQLSAQDVAIAVLASEAGKVLSYDKNAGQWAITSNLVHLSARAVLHSVPSFADELDYYRRQVIRRALIYASRSSDFGPVRFPIDLSDQAGALRQWTEVLAALPHRLQAVADEVELFGIVTEVEHAFRSELIDGIATMQSEVISGVYASDSGVFFMQLKQVLTICRKTIGSVMLKRLEELVFIVSQRQKLHNMSLDFHGDGEKTPIPSHERLFPPLSFGQVKLLADLHGLKLEDVKDWSALRVVFNSFGWLGRRVGDHSVPENSIIFLVAKTMDAGNRVLNEKPIGRPGMVAFRASSLEARWGKQWYTRLALIQDAAMAETTEQYARLMAGKPREDEPEENDLSATA